MTELQQQPNLLDLICMFRHELIEVLHKIIISASITEKFLENSKGRDQIATLYSIIQDEVDKAVSLINDETKLFSMIINMGLHN